MSKEGKSCHPATKSETVSGRAKGKRNIGGLGSCGSVTQLWKRAFGARMIGLLASETWPRNMSQL
jgi:hypothetical protein